MQIVCLHCVHVLYMYVWWSDIKCTQVMYLIEVATNLLEYMLWCHLYMYCTCVCACTSINVSWQLLWFRLSGQCVFEGGCVLGSYSWTGVLGMDMQTKTWNQQQSSGMYLYVHTLRKGLIANTYNFVIWLTLTFCWYYSNCRIAKPKKQPHPNDYIPCKNPSTIVQ